MPRPTPFQSWLIAFALSVGAVIICIAYVDRPVAAFMHAHVRPTALWRWTEAAFIPLTALGGVFFVFFLASGAWALRRRPLPGWTVIPLLCAWAVTWALAFTTILKRFVGRSEVDPTWLVDHTYEFRWLHGKPDYQAFPSGTTALASAALAVLWLLAPRLRAPAGVIVVLIAVALVIMNSHWVADVIGGGFLGVSIGWMTVRLRSERA